MTTSTPVGPAIVGQHNETPTAFPSRQEVLGEVRCFVKGSQQDGDIANVDVARSGLFLLKTLPSARGAVMEHLCNVFDAAVKVHLLQKELNKDMSENAELENVIEDVKKVILGFVKSNPVAWAPIISAWSIELLGHISSKYAEKSGVPHSSLNEVLQLWMTCPATKSLIDISSQCFSSMVGNTPDSCVDALLEASVKHSPHFDWVVAHIGSCFPMTIISRVLLCGLRDYCLHGESRNAGRREPKVASVVSILGHLATRHGHDIRMSIVKLFKESLQSGRDDLLSSVTPFLLHLASLSPMLLNIMSQDFVETVTPEVMRKLVKQMEGKPSKTYDGNSMFDLVTHLATQCESVAFELLKFLLLTGFPSQDEMMDTDQSVESTIQKTARKVLNKVLSDLEKLVLVRKLGPTPMSPFLRGLQGHCPDICEFILKADVQSARWLQRLLVCISLQSNEAVTAEILYSILERNTVAAQLSYFIDVLQNIQGKYPDVLGVTVNMCMQKMITYPEGNIEMLKNLKQLLLWENAESSRWTGLRLNHHLANHLDTLGHLLELEDLECASLAMTILSLVKVPVNVSVNKSIKLAQCTVVYFFRAMHLTDTLVKVAQCEKCSKFMVDMCKLPAMQKTLLRLIVEETLTQKNALLIGSDATFNVAGKGQKENQEFLTESIKRGQAVADLRPRQGTLFHGGVIGQGFISSFKVPHMSQDHQIINKSFLLETVWNLCHTQYENGHLTKLQVMDPKIGKSFALLLIELITPDVMYNGIPWLEEEFCKVTVKRDLQVGRILEDNLILWDFIDIAAYGSGSLCYCSAIMRSVTATLITFWEGCRGKLTSDSPRQLYTTCRLIQAMRKGQLLLPPLCFIDEIFPFLPPFETSVILHDVWLFMHEKPPVPNEKDNALRMSEPKPYLDAVRNVLHSRIDTLGHLFTHFFPSETSSS